MNCPHCGRNVAQTLAQLRNRIYPYFVKKSDGRRSVITNQKIREEYIKKNIHLADKVFSKAYKDGCGRYGFRNELTRTKDAKIFREKLIKEMGYSQASSDVFNAYFYAYINVNNKE